MIVTLIKIALISIENRIDLNTFEINYYRQLATDLSHRISFSKPSIEVIEHI